MGQFFKIAVRIASSTICYRVWMLDTIPCEHHFLEKFEIRRAILEAGTNTVGKVCFKTGEPAIFEFSFE